jgi:SsrA-binding protein
MENKNKVEGKTLAQNKKARHDFFILEGFEAGIELVGTEVKSVRQGKLNLKESYVDIRNGEAFLIGAHISPYEQGNIFNKDPLRTRKLLLKKQEIMRLTGKLKEKGLTIVPLEVYMKRNWIKINIAVAQGKKNYDKRDSKLEADAKRNMDRALKERMR